MNKIQELHNKAMTFAEMALLAKLKGNIEEYNNFLKQAYKNESKAANLMVNDFSSEPSRSIIYRSAASLAFECNEFREAERLLASGLSGNPPEEIAEELRDLLEKVNFGRHLDLQGLYLNPEEIQMSIAGKAIGLGIAPCEEFVSRIEVAKKLVYRTIERMMNKPYREGGSVSGEVKDFKLFVSFPKAAASFAVSLKVSGPKQKSIPFAEKSFRDIESNKVIDEMLLCLDLFNKSKENELRKKISQKAYYSNFIALAKNIAPDGKEVNLVGFTTIRKGIENIVKLTKTRDEIEDSFKYQLDEEIKEKKQPITITGRLLYADARIFDKRAIRIIDKKGKSHNIFVDEGLMTDIVKPLWEEDVTVTGFYRGNEIILKDIKKASNS